MATRFPFSSAQLFAHSVAKTLQDGSGGVNQEEFFAAILDLKVGTVHTTPTHIHSAPVHTKRIPSHYALVLRSHMPRHGCYPSTH